MPVYQEIIAFLCLVTRYDVKSNHVISQFLIIMLALKYLHCFPIDHVTSFFFRISHSCIISQSDTLSAAAGEREPI